MLFTVHDCFIQTNTKVWVVVHFLEQCGDSMYRLSLHFPMERLQLLLWKYFFKEGVVSEFSPPVSRHGFRSRKMIFCTVNTKIQHVAATIL